MNKFIIQNTIGLILLTFSIISCVTVPPITVYNRSYVGSKLKLKQNDSEQFSLSVDMSPFLNSKNSVAKNNARYVLGSFVSNLKKIKSKNNTSQSRQRGSHINLVDKFKSITMRNGISDQIDYNASITIDAYDDIYSVQSQDKKVSILKETTKCFYVEITISNPKNTDDSFTFQSHGCPGMSDPRLIASRIMKIMLNDLWLIDSARTEVIQMNGASPDSWFSAFETDPEVDQILGF